MQCCGVLIHHGAIDDPVAIDVRREGQVSFRRKHRALAVWLCFWGVCLFQVITHMNPAKADSKGKAGRPLSLRIGQDTLSASSCLNQCFAANSAHRSPLWCSLTKAHHKMTSSLPDVYQRWWLQGRDNDWSQVFPILIHLLVYHT